MRAKCLRQYADEVVDAAGEMEQGVRAHWRTEMRCCHSEIADRLLWVLAANAWPLKEVVFGAKKNLLRLTLAYQLAPKTI